MTETLTTEDVLRMRMRALGLAAPRAGEAPAPGPAAGSAAGSGSERTAEVARRMLALQAQDWRSARWALGVRAPALTGGGIALDDIAAAFTERRIVRSWPMRGTVHVVLAEDIDWIQSVTNRKPIAGAAKRRQFLGMSDAVLDRLVDASLEAMRGTSLDRDELAAIWTEAGIEWQSNWRYHIIWWLCQNGLATFGPVGGSGEPRLVLAEEWIGDRRTPEDPLAELASRYAAARGPIRAKDLAWWAGITAVEAKRGLAAATEQGALVPVRLAEHSGAAGELWSAPEALGTSSPLPGWQLLPAFDEHLLGYTARDPQLAPEHFERVLPSRNGMFFATVVSGGHVVGTWKRIPRKVGGIAVTPFPDASIDAEALRPEAERWAAFHGVSPGPILVE